MAGNYGTKSTPSMVEILSEGRNPEPLTNLKLDLSPLMEKQLPTSADIYDPWKDRWNQIQVEGRTLSLPEFSRSLVVRFSVKQ